MDDRIVLCLSLFCILGPVFALIDEVLESGRAFRADLDAMMRGEMDKDTVVARMKARSYE